MHILTDIPFVLDAEALMEKLRVERGSDDETVFRGLIDLAKNVGRPKAVYREAFIEARDEATVRVGGMTFTSRMLVRNLAEAQRLFAYVATCGREVHEAVEDDGDFLKAFWWDMIKQQLLTQAGLYLGEHVRSRHRLGRTATMSPGAGDAAVWPIEQQAELFALIGNVRGAIGVELTDSFLMIPNKSVSGVRFPSELDFRSCQVCRRPNCPGRNAPFDKQLWDDLQHA